MHSLCQLTTIQVAIYYTRSYSTVWVANSPNRPLQRRTYLRVTQPRGHGRQACRYHRRGTRQWCSPYRVTRVVRSGVPVLDLDEHPTEGALLFKQWYHNGLKIPGDTIDHLRETARKAGVHVVIGVAERDAGTMYNTQVFFDN